MASSILLTVLFLEASSTSVLAVAIAVWPLVEALKVSKAASYVFCAAAFAVSSAAFSIASLSSAAVLPADASILPSASYLSELAASKKAVSTF